MHQTAESAPKKVLDFPLAAHSDFSVPHQEGGTEQFEFTCTLASSQSSCG